MMAGFYPGMPDLCSDVRHDGNALARALVEYEVAAGRRRREFLDASFGGFNVRYSFAPKYTTGFNSEDV